jgi:O-antigen ligase
MSRWTWYAFLALVVLLPLPFGGFRPWAWSLAGIAVSTMLLVWAAEVVSGRLPLFWRHSLWPPFALFAAVVVWILVQALMPAAPDQTHPLWQLASTALGSPLSGRISAAPEDGVALLLRLLTGAGCFWLALQYGHDRDRAWQLVTWFALAAAIYSSYGLVNFIAGNRTLLFYTRWAYEGDVTGTFVNRNSYATYAGMGVLALVVMLARAFHRRWRIGDAGLSWLGRRVEALGGLAGVLLGCVVVTAMALLQSHSRMGLLASVIGAAVLLLLLRLRGILRGWIIPATVTATAAFLYVASGSATFDRIADGGMSGRPELFALTEQGIASAPMLGSGYGSFANLFQMYRDLTLPDRSEYLMAHSTYLELAFGLGIPAAAALLVAMLWLAITCLVGVFRRSRDEELPALGFSIVVLVGVHSLLDFSAQIPGVGYSMLALLGMAVAQAYPMIRPKYERGRD